MKRAIYLLITLLLITCNSLYSRNLFSGNSASAVDSMNVISTPDLYNLSMKWAAEYNRLFPGANIRIINVADPAKAGEMINEGNIGFVSNEQYAGMKNESLWKVVVGRDVIVPVINSKNPFLDEINKQGISPAMLTSFLGNKDSRSWGTLLKNGKNTPASYYCVNDLSGMKSLAGFLNVDQTLVAGENTASSEDMVSAIQKDPNALGFCRIVDILDISNQKIVENIRLLPIDRNGNGLLDFNEKIYDDFNLFSRGVWIGKYPKALISNIYSVSSVQPENVNEVAFLKWVLSDGQQFLLNNGYTDLLVSERQSGTEKLYNAKIGAGVTSGEKNLLKSFMFVIASVILIGLIASSVNRQRQRRKSAVKITGAVSPLILDEKSLVVPGGLYFDKTHTWAFLEENGFVKVGIDDFLQHITGKITRIKMKELGKTVKKGEEILSIIQNGKQLNLYAPVSGTIVEQNISLDKNSSALNSAPYTEGWIYKIEPTNWNRESQLLFMAEKQRQFIKNEFSRLKDFLSAALNADTGRYSLILQDGGEIRDGVLSEMGPEVWEDFQTNFIDPSKQVWFYEIF